MSAPTEHFGFPSDPDWAGAGLQLRLALLATELLMVDPVGLRGLLVRGPAGPVRDSLHARIEDSRSVYRMTQNTSTEQLLGGLDTAQTLATGKPVHREGLLSRARGGVLLLPAADRLSTPVLHVLAQALDQALDQSPDTAPTAARSALLVFDESLEDEAGIADTALGERLALHVSLPTVPAAVLEDAVRAHDTLLSEMKVSPVTAMAITAVDVPDAVLRDITQLSLRLGIDSIHAINACLRVARVHAAIHGRSHVSEEDAAIGVQLALGPRARAQPPLLEPAPETTDQQSAEESEQASDSAADTDSAPSDDPVPPGSTGANEPSADEDAGDHDDSSLERLIDAAAAVLPGNVLDSLQQRRHRNTSSQGLASSGRDRRVFVLNGARGRPAGVRRPRSRQQLARLDVLETLKAAIPHQRVRQQQAASSASTSRRCLAIRSSDLRVKRFKQSPRSTTVFVVDASGSAAMHRLAEAKGATQLMLGECYIRRDRVALITFSKQGATLALPPTRSLTRAKRTLQGLPGGGGTPLAAGLQAAEQVLQQLQRAGEFPVAVFMTDARANVALDGSHDRATATADAEIQARHLASLGARLLFVDTSPRPRAPAQRLAGVMQARYLPLPRSGVEALPDIVMGRA